MNFDGLLFCDGQLSVSLVCTNLNFHRATHCMQARYIAILFDRPSVCHADGLCRRNCSKIVKLLTPIVHSPLLLLSAIYCKISMEFSSTRELNTSGV